MAQVFWRYRAMSGDSYDICLYHGEPSGHVVIYCGTEIIHIDFSVFEDHTYSFLAGDDLLELEVKYRDATPSYSLTRAADNNFVPNHTSPDRINTHTLISLIIAVVVLITVLVIILLL
jgi:hypothetical protein